MHTPDGQDSVLIQCFPSCAPQNAEETVKKVKVLVTQSCPTLCDPKDCSLPGSCVHGISQARTGFLQARILEWLPCPPPGDLPDPGIEPTSLCLLHWQVGSLPLAPPGKGQAKWRAQCSLESRPASFLLPGLPPSLLQTAGILSCLHLISLFSLSHPRSLSDLPRSPTPNGWRTIFSPAGSWCRVSFHLCTYPSQPPVSSLACPFPCLPSGYSAFILG